MVGGLSVRAAEATVLAKGKGFEVTQDQLDEAFINLRATLAAQGRSIAENQRANIERQLLEKLVLTRLLLGKATDDDRKQGAEKVARLIDEQKARARSEARFEAQIRAAGMSPDSFEKQLLERAVCEEVLDRELRPRLGVTPEKIRSFYDQNPSDFRQPERVHLQQIVFSARNAAGAELSEVEKTEKKMLASKILERLRQGEDMAALARQYSDDPPGRERGGEYIYPVGRMAPELEVLVATIPTNQVSDVVTTSFGFHLVKVLARLPGEVVAFDGVTNQIKMRLELEATQALLPDYQKRLFEEAKVEFLTKPRSQP